MGAASAASSSGPSPGAGGRDLRGTATGSSYTPLTAADLPTDIPPFFLDILTDLLKLEREFGGVRGDKTKLQIGRKVKAADFRNSYTDFEYIYLTVVGFAQLHMHCEEIVGKNNGKVFTQNPGVQLLESLTGMTMHADREGANNLLRTAPASLIEAYAVGRAGKGGLRAFFREGFDRKADPCLEGRVGRIMEYLDAKRQAGSSVKAPPWQDVSLNKLAAGATQQEIIGEHLRVFVNECTWRWCCMRGLDYKLAKDVRLTDAHAADFTRLYNADTFRAAMYARGVIPEGPAKQWEVSTESGSWLPFDAEANSAMDRARKKGLATCEIRVRNFMYDIDFNHMVQRNRKTRKERPIRCVEATKPVAQPGGSQMTSFELETAIAYFAEMETLPLAEPAVVEEMANPEF